MLRVKPKQLYKLIGNIPVPNVTYFDEITGEIIHTKKVSSQFSFKYPNGAPCIPVEIYLNEKLKNLKLGTVKNKAGNITHLIRNIFHHGIDFESLTTIKIEKLYQVIAAERKSDGTRSRNRNTIKTILQTWVEFLKWYASYFLLETHFIGFGNKNRIELKQFQKADSRGIKHVIETFNIKIERDTTIPKPKMTQGLIQKLWAGHLAITKIESTKVSKALTHKFTYQQLKDHYNFLRVRRELILLILESLGVRPCELIKIPRTCNFERLKNEELFIIGAKGGNDRTVSIDLLLAKRIKLYLNQHVQKLEVRLKSSGLLQQSESIDDALILNSTTGKAISSSTMYSLFRKIKIEAGLDQKVCASMFRHRFITILVKFNLISFTKSNPKKSRYNIIEDDYLSVLKKVAKLTGHRDPKSLLHYIDLAWDELGAFSEANDAKVLQDRISSIQHQIDIIQIELKSNPNDPKMIASFLEVLRDLTVINKSNTFQPIVEIVKSEKFDYYE